MIKLQTDKAEGWEAYLQLRYGIKKGKTFLRENVHKGPLRVQKTLAQEKEVCHTYILHPPGGVVGGDSLHLDIYLEEGSSALITTPGATKFYRSTGLEANMVQQITVSKGASMEWFPQDTILFPGANAHLSTDIHLEKGAFFMGWEVISLGLPTQNNTFNSGSLFSSVRLYLEKEPLYFDILRIGEDTPVLTDALLGFSVVASFIATDVQQHMVDELRDILPPPNDKSVLGLTLKDELLITRYLGHSTFEARENFEKLWAGLRPALLNRNPDPPRIWAT